MKVLLQKVLAALLVLVCVIAKPLSPKQLPLPGLFSAWDKNATVALPGGQQPYTVGSIQQDGNTSERSKFYVLPKIVTPKEVEDLLGILRSTENEIPLDTDMDSVDGMSSLEIFVDNDELRAGKPSKHGWTTHDQKVKRRVLRTKLKRVTEKILSERITPYVRKTYPNICSGYDADGFGGEAAVSGGGNGRACTPCYSLLRRYRPGVDRESHGIHHDGHAIVTVVVSLSDYGREYQGGLYVAANRGKERSFIPLSRGDAVVHQSDLLHGVKVMPASKGNFMASGSQVEITPDGRINVFGNHMNDHGENGATRSGRKMPPGAAASRRWSWILWYRDSETCKDHSHEWFEACANSGVPSCEMMYATKVGNTPGLSAEDSMQKMLYWNQRAAEHGHGAARVKLARAFWGRLPSALPKSKARARALFQDAIRDSDDPNAHYGLAEMLLEEMATMYPESQLDGANVVDAVRKVLGNVIDHLEASAKGGHPFAMFNLGLAHLYGYYNYGSGERNPSLAGGWFLESGLPEGFYAYSMYLRSIGEITRAEAFEKRAYALGLGSQVRQLARRRTGLGGASGINLNIAWPPWPDGKTKPPPW